ncbi:hypothetical protein H9Y04_07235 [Streptomyces sp. TRM66268-LWL]|uniref:HEAT repeat domain-containing protein n=1 Tax=Streptomyces polyasparticus TaxID=2767826 RepID=A0ABR7SDD2_9ACTN|nr:hypothetical protein [Streptomyces polyasparticus]MBC9712363.1 hypothetical protein [Streptomyces polyasparticus]
MTDLVCGALDRQHGLLEATRSWSAEDWLAWDDEVRVLGRWHSQALPSRRELFGGSALGETERLAVALCHPDGRVRERALGEVTTDSGLTPLVAVRSTDWAGPVRDRARALLRDLLTAAEAVRYAGLLVRLGERARGEFGAGLLRELIGPDSVRPLLHDPDRQVRRHAHRLAVDRRWLDARASARRAAEDPDAVVQQLCADAALRDVTEEDADEVLHALLGARSARARSAGVTALRRLGRGERAWDFLVDRNALVRACARYVVRQDGGDPREFYAELCADPLSLEVPPGAVIGLAECGDRADAGVLWACTGHEWDAVRASAVAGLRALDLALPDRLLPLLDDESPKVVREVVAALLPDAARLPGAWLAERLAPGRERHTRVAAFRLLSARGGVPQLRVCVSLLENEDEDERLRRWAEQSVQRWQPGREVPRGDAEVAALLTRSAHLFSGDALRERRRAAGVPVESRDKGQESQEKGQERQTEGRAEGQVEGQLEKRARTWGLRMGQGMRRLRRSRG